MRRIIRNRIRCKKCGDIIESTSAHDFKQRSCGAVFVDGGHNYLRRGFTNGEDDLDELSEVEEIKAPTNIDATQMTAEEIHNKLDKGYQDAMVGRRHDAKEALAAFRMEKK